MKFNISTGTSALTLILVAFAPQAFAQGVTTRPVKPTLDSLQAQVTQLTAAFQAEHTARLAAEANEAATRAAADTAEATTRASAITAVTNSVNSLSTTVGNHTTAITSLQTSTATLTTTVNGFSGAIDDLQDKTQYISVSGTTTLFTGTNVQIVNGMSGTETVNGVGNLILGYNEENGQDRSGSHNLVVGAYHSYTSFGGAVMGYSNTISNSYATILGGIGNNSSGFGSAILGGDSNIASGHGSTVSGGREGYVIGYDSSIGGGVMSLETRNYAWRAGSLATP